MSGIQQMLMASAMQLSNLDGSAHAHSGSVGKPSNARVNYGSNGTIVDGGSSVGGTHFYSGAANWFSPTTTGIGSSYYIRFTLLDDPSGVASASPSFGTIGSLSAGGFVQCPADTLEDNTAQYKVEIFYDAGGAALVGSGIVDLESIGS